MAHKKESFFWTSYSDLMTSLFFVMLVLFVSVIAVMGKRMGATQKELEDIKKVQRSTDELRDKNEYFKYDSINKKFVLRMEVKYPKGESDLGKMVAEDKEKQLSKLEAAGVEIKQFLDRHKENKYIIIIEGQASKEPKVQYYRNYELSYERALGLMRFWNHLNFGDNCEILISGSGDGTLKTNSQRESVESENQRFLIHILPKNILENSKKNISTIK